MAQNGQRCGRHGKRRAQPHTHTRKRQRIFIFFLSAVPHRLNRTKMCVRVCMAARMKRNNINDNAQFAPLKAKKIACETCSTIFSPLRTTIQTQCIGIFAVTFFYVLHYFCFCFSYAMNMKWLQILFHMHNTHINTRRAMPFLCSHCNSVGELQLCKAHKKRVFNE